MSIDVTTRSYDNTRSGTNPAETVLTPAAVAARGITTLLTLETPDDPRLEAQPLYVSALTVAGQVRDVIYQASMGNTVYAWDAVTGQPLWKSNLGMPITGTRDIDGWMINIKWGILSTPVIDRTTNTLYACAWISTDGTGNYQTGQHFIAALDLVTGQYKPNKPLMSLEGATYTPPAPGKPQNFKSAERKQRAALAIVNGAVLVGFGTVAETAQTARGWLIAIDTVKWDIAATWCSTCRGSGGGIWMSGSGPAIGADGSIWLVTGNGDFDGAVDFGESVVRLRYTPPAGNTAGSLKLTGWWTPFTDKGRTGGNSEGEGHTAAERAVIAAMPKATNYRKHIQMARMGMAMADGDWGDQDLGASGIVLLEKQGIGLVSGKDGILYPINLANPGNTMPGDLQPTTAAANFAKLASPPILYTFYDPNMNPATPNPADLNWWPENATHHLHGTPVAWASTAHGQTHFCGGENGNLRLWSVNSDKTSAYLGCGTAYASANCAESANGPKGGMPGWSICLSANGGTGGIVWGIIPYGDANMQLTPGRLIAYDAANLAQYPGGSGELVPLWDSQNWGWNFLHPKFNRPVAVNGKLLVPTYDGRVLVLGLA